MKDEIDRLIDIDPIDLVEKMGGTPGHALGLMQAKTAALKKALKGNDTYFCIPWSEFKQLLHNSVFNFEMGMSQPFGKGEEWCLWYERSRGLILIAESHRGGGDATINSGRLHFQYETDQQVIELLQETGGCQFPKDESKRFSKTRMWPDPDETMIYSRYLDIRTAMFHHLLAIDLGPGKLLPTWVQEEGTPSLWLFNYEEVYQRTARHENLNWDDQKKDDEKFEAAKLSQMPQAVRDIIGKE